MTIAHLLAAWERFKPKQVHVFCRPDDLEWTTAACELLPGVRVFASEFVPTDQVYVLRDFADLDVWRPQPGADLPVR
jgi:hypothetical protein